MEQQPLAYPLDFLPSNKVQRFGVFFADSLRFAFQHLGRVNLTLYHQKESEWEQKKDERH